MMMDERPADETRKSFGWNETKNGFLLGRTLYHSAGSSVLNSLTGPAETLALALTSGGDFASWQKNMMRVASNTIGSFAICLSAGSPLHSLMSSEGGSIVALRAHSSGTGKTTSLAAALSVWGKWQDFSNWSNNTTISNTGKWETSGNLPIGWEEAVVEKDEDLRKRVLAFTDGQPRVRTGRDGVQKAVGSAWSTFLICTSNLDLRRRLGNMAGATEGPTALVFQLELADKIDGDGGVLLDSFSKHYGWGGSRLASTLVGAGVAEKLTEELAYKNLERMNRLGLPNSARFACRAITCAETGGGLLVATQCLPALDVGATIRDMESMLVRQVEADHEFARSHDIVLEFIRQKQGEIIAVGPNMEQPTLRCISARYEKGRLSVPISEWSKWIARFNKSEQEAEREALALGHSIRRETINLAHGTGYPAQPKTRCVVISLDAVAQADAAEEVSKVVSIGRRR